jgi:hypothetical protein
VLLLLLLRRTPLLVFGKRNLAGQRWSYIQITCIWLVHTTHSISTLSSVHFKSPPAVMITASSCTVFFFVSFWFLLTTLVLYMQQQIPLAVTDALITVHLWCTIEPICVMPHFDSLFWRYTDCDYLRAQFSQGSAESLLVMAEPTVPNC